MWFTFSRSSPTCLHNGQACVCRSAPRTADGLPKAAGCFLDIPARRKITIVKGKGGEQPKSTGEKFSLNYVCVFFFATLAGLKRSYAYTRGKCDRGVLQTSGRSGLTRGVRCGLRMAEDQRQNLWMKSYFKTQGDERRGKRMCERERET